MPTTRTVFEQPHAKLHVTDETDDIVALSLEGEFDMANKWALVDEIQRALSEDKHLIIDLSSATFIDSHIINVLVGGSSGAKERRRTAVLQLGTAASVERVIEITGVERVLLRTKSRDDAITIIQQSAATG